MSFLLLALLFLPRACRWGERWCCTWSTAADASWSWTWPCQGSSGPPLCLHCLGHISGGSWPLCRVPASTWLSWFAPSHLTQSVFYQQQRLKTKVHLQNRIHERNMCHYPGLVNINLWTFSPTNLDLLFFKEKLIFVALATSSSSYYRNMKFCLIIPHRKTVIQHKCSLLFTMDNLDFKTYT